LIVDDGRAQLSVGGPHKPSTRGKAPTSARRRHGFAHVNIGGDHTVTAAIIDLRVHYAEVVNRKARAVE
jgi:hypothetical protein